MPELRPNNRLPVPHESRLCTYPRFLFLHAKALKKMRTLTPWTGNCSSSVS
jgi:hypothetical protein